jgi:ATP-dependent RNA helicase DeaD
LQTFNTIGLSDKLVKALAEQGITEPTAIQEQSIPLLLQGDNDFIGLAQTGTGKTAAFGLPLIELTNEEVRATQSLVIAPTRELAVQTAENLKEFARYHKNITVDVVYGGTPIYPQIKRIKDRTPNILVATPGRLIDLMDRKVIFLDKINYVVLDEADEILNMGFKEDLDKILSLTPEDKNTWLFSATMPAGIRRIVKNYMVGPKEVTISKKEQVNKNIEHRYVWVQRRDRREVLQRLVDANPEFYGLIFCRTKIDTQELAEYLLGQGYAAGALHGDVSQSQRDETMKRFKSGRLKILVATDVAARGIDVDDLTHVIHYALPDDHAFYTHRSGRTARAGKQGVSIAILHPGQERKLKALRSELGIEIQKMEVPSIESIRESKLMIWTQKIIETEVTKLPPELLKACDQAFAELSKEDLLQKLLTLEIAKEPKRSKELGSADRERFDSSSRRERGNSREGGRPRDRGAERERGKIRKRGKLDRYFINIGSLDKLSRRDLVDLISDKTKVPGGTIDIVDFGKKHSYFEIDHKNATRIGHVFQDFHFQGRPIRVNKDQGRR